MVIEKDSKLQVVIRINLGGLLTRSDYESVYNILFARRLEHEPVNIRTCVNRLAVDTRSKMTLKEDEDKDSILIFWRYYSYLTTLPTFKSDILSVYDESDREYRRLNKDKSYLLIGTNKIRTLSPLNSGT